MDFSRLARLSRLILFDKRATSRSDRGSVSDLEMRMDDPKRSAMSMLFAATYPKGRRASAATTPFKP